MNWPTRLHTFARCSLRGAALLMVLAIAVSLLEAPMHSASHHADGGGAHHCAVCALAKGQVDSFGVSCAVAVFELAASTGTVIEILLPVSAIVVLLPPSRAPPVSVIPS